MLPAYASINLNSSHFRLDASRPRRPVAEIAHPVLVAARLVKRDVQAAAAATAAGEHAEAERLIERARRLRALMHHVE